MLLVASCNGVVRALNKTTGALAWFYDSGQDGSGGAQFHGNPAVSKETVFIGSDRSAQYGGAYLYAFENHTGKLRWKHAVGAGTWSDILQDGSNLFLVTAEDELLSLDATTGRENWKIASGVSNDDFLMTSSPALSHGRVFFGGMNGTVYAVDENSGRLIWKRELGLWVSTAVAVLGDSVYLGTIANRLYRLAADTGAVVAEYPLDARPLGSITIGDDSILVPVGTQLVLCLTSDLKTERWRKQASQAWTIARPYVIQGTVLLGEQGKLRGFRLNDGRELWAEEVGGVIRGVGYDQSTLYVGTLKGMIFAYPSPFR